MSDALRSVLRARLNRARVLGLWLLVPIGLLLGSPAQAGLWDDVASGNSYAAWDLCTRANVGREDARKVRSDFVAPVLQPLSYTWLVNQRPGVKVEVLSFLPLLTSLRTAVYRPGLGCTLLPPGGSESSLRAQPFKPVSLAARSSAPWPQGEGAAEAQALAPTQAVSLSQVADQVFAEVKNAKPNQRQNTLSFLVAHQGRLVYERYATGYSRNQPLLGWSMTKSLTALIAGAMATDGRIRLNEPIGLTAWAGTPKAAITWEHLLTMSSGLAWSEDSGSTSDANEMIYKQADQGSWAASKPLVKPPGSQFVYSTGSSAIATLRMKQLLGNQHQSLYDYYQQRLLAPLGVRDALIEIDISGTPIGGARGLLRPLDWLRLGQLVAQGGRWGAQTLIAPEVMAQLLAPSAANPDYAASIWRLPTNTADNPLLARLPADTVWFSGYMGQFVVIVPSRQLVVLRQGASLDELTTTLRVLEATASLVEKL